MSSEKPSWLVYLETLAAEMTQASSQHEIGGMHLYLLGFTAGVHLSGQISEQRFTAQSEAIDEAARDALARCSGVAS